MSEQPQRIGEQLGDEIDQTSLADFEKELDGAIAARQSKMGKTTRRPSAEDSLGDTEEEGPDTEVPTDETLAPDESEQEDAGQDTQEPAETPPASPDSPAPDQEPFSYTFNDQVFDEEAIKDGLQLRAWRDTLNPQAMQAINALLTGTHLLVERSEYERIQSGDSSRATTQEKPQTTSLPQLSDEDLSDLPPAVAQAIRSNQETLANLQKQQAEAEQRQQQAAQTEYQRRMTNAITSGKETIKQRYQLTDAEYEKVDKEAVHWAPAAIQRFGPEQGVVDALDFAYQRVFQQREIARQIAAQNAAVQQTTEQKNKTATRKANASALGKGSSASGPSTAPSKGDKRAMLRADIESFLTADN